MNDKLTPYSSVETLLLRANVSAYAVFSHLAGRDETTTIQTLVFGTEETFSIIKNMVNDELNLSSVA